MKKTLLMAVAAMSAFGATISAQAQEVSISGNVAFTSDYRFRGVSLSDNNFAVQGGFDVATESGFYVGTWASSIEEFNGAETELDFYGGYGFEASGLSFDVGLIGYFYPSADDSEYYELYASVGGAVEVFEWALGVAFAPEQDNLGEEDNLYIYADGGMPLGESGFSLGAHIGLEDGAFGDEKVDYSLSLDTSAAGVDLSLAYIGVENADGFGDISDDSLVVTVGKSF